MLNHTSLENYYVTNFELVQHHKYSLVEIEDMIPFERSLYIQMLLDHLEEERQELERQKQQHGGR